MIIWQVKSFFELSLQQLYDLLQLREEVFQLEQKCLFRDIDGLDQHSEHILAYDKNKLVAYLRIYEKDHCSFIGRVVTAPVYRGRGLGREITQQALDYLKKHHPHRHIKIQAQHYLKNFYNSFGFEMISDPFDEDGIEHIMMQLSFTNACKEKA